MHGPVDQLRALYRRQREQLFEEAVLLKAAVDAGITVGELSKLLGVSRSSLFLRQRLLMLSPTVRAAVVAGRVWPEVARSRLAGLPASKQVAEMRRLSKFTARVARVNGR